MSNELELARELVKRLEEAERNEKVRLSELNPGDVFKIGEHDLEVKKNQAEKFAKVGHPLKVMLVLRWRENHYEELATNKIETFVAMLEEFYKIDKKLVKAWSNFIVMMLPK